MKYVRHVNFELDEQCSLSKVGERLEVCDFAQYSNKEISLKLLDSRHGWRRVVSVHRRLPSRRILRRDVLVAPFTVFFHASPTYLSHFDTISIARHVI